jgi:hypothetical protein
MIFSKELISKILNGTKTETRRLVKDNEFFDELNKAVVRIIIMNEGFEDGFGRIKSHSASERVKWRVGKDYAVQLKRGGKGLWFCSECKDLYDADDIFQGEGCSNALNVKKDGSYMCETELKPLRLKVLDIKKERLLDITESGAKREGFNSKKDFLNYFYGLYKKKVDKDSIRKRRKWNPFVWKIKFKVEEDEEKLFAVAVNLNQKRK